MAQLTKNVGKAVREVEKEHRERKLWLFHCRDITFRIDKQETEDCAHTHTHNALSTLVTHIQNMHAHTMMISLGTNRAISFITVKTEKPDRHTYYSAKAKFIQCSHESIQFKAMIHGSRLATCDS